MSINRQLPMLCLRGSVANITMANLEEEEQQHVSELTDMIAEHPEMQAKRNSMIHNLQGTIGSDYRDDRAVADNEYYIAIWRGVVNLFYHRKHDFACRACGQSHYVTNRNKVALIDRQQVPCPNCGKVEIEDPGSQDANGEPISGFKPGSFVSLDEYRNVLKSFPADREPPKSRSCIKFIPRDRLYSNPHSIIEDNDQLRKFFGEYVWNYYRQQIRENQRSEHNKQPRRILDKADRVIHQELISLCRKHKLDFYVPDNNSGNKRLSVGVSGYLTPPEFTCDLTLLRRRALSFGITIELTERYIHVLREPDAEIIDGTITAPEHVTFQEDSETDGTYFITQLSYKTVGGYRMEQDDHIAMVDAQDVMEAVRSALPDGVCKAVFDIDSQQGEIYERFSERYGNNTPRKYHIAEFLGVANRTVGMCRDQIKIWCYYHNMAGPSH